MTTFKWMSLGALLGFFVAIGASCGPAKCTPQSCAFGCCDSSGTCQAGSSDAQCGGQGRACAACVLGQTCQLGQCVLVGGGGAGNGSTGGGSGATGGGGGSTGGGGGSSTGGGGGTTGGGGGTTGGGGGATGGGGGSGDTTCTALASASTSFFAGRTSCSANGFTLNSNPNMLTQCNEAIGACTSMDRQAIQSFSTCLLSAQRCTTGNDAAAISGFTACASDLVLSPSCQAITGGSMGGGGGTTGGGGGTTGGGGGTTGGGGGTTGGGGGTTGGGGGTTGGGGGTTGGGGGSTPCTPLGPFTVVRGVGQYDSMNNVTLGLGANTSTDPTDILELQLWWVPNVTLPITQDLSTAGTFNTCATCALLRRGCTVSGSSTTCTGGDYLARSGSMTVTSAPMGTGTFSASLPGTTTFREWNYQTDMEVAGGRCFTISSAQMNVAVP
ncbi:MAG: hypothetical protein ACOZQL_19390 [Myxococcota bacterium]